MTPSSSSDIVVDYRNGDWRYRATVHVADLELTVDQPCGGFNDAPPGELYPALPLTVQPLQEDRTSPLEFAYGPLVELVTPDPDFPGETDRYSLGIALGSGCDMRGDVEPVNEIPPEGVVRGTLLLGGALAGSFDERSVAGLQVCVSDGNYNLLEPPAPEPICAPVESGT